MNNRWKELNEEAEKYALSKVNSAGYCFETNMYIGSLVKMKLAELIVRECALIAKTAAPYSSDDLILKRFGFDDGR
jgi:hypothetical protein